MRADALRTGDELRRPEIKVSLRPAALPAYVALVELHGEHDLGTAEAVRVALAPLAGDVLVDLSDCDFIDSTVIGALVGKARALDAEGHRLELVVPARQTTIGRVLDVMRMRELVTVHATMPLGGTDGDGTRRERPCGR